MLWLTIVALLAVNVYGYSQAALQDQITNLPGLPSGANFTMFSGYIVVNETNNRSLFYWFFESLNSPKTDPLVLWTNGGPGCSGFLGLLTEQGPFRPQPDGSLLINPYTWVNVSNMVFIETPAGVGFSFSMNPNDYTTGDSQTAQDNYNFILGFLTKFPEFQKNEFFISSESYGGHYMPTLAKVIYEGNKNGGTPHVNFRGVFVGNPLTDPVENAQGTYDTWWGHQLVSQPLYEYWYKNCSDGAIQNDDCYNLENALSQQVGNLDPYALDFPVCNGSNLLNTERYWFYRHVIHDVFKRPLPKLYKDAENSVGEQYQACSENYAVSYLNEPSVQTALHANPTNWSACSNIVNYNVTDINSYMEPVWQWLVQNTDLHMTIISGDDDSVCGTLGTQTWLWNMNWTVNSNFEWVTWTLDNQVAGYVLKFENALNFVTVHTAGHMIPQTQPARSFLSFTNFLKGIF